VYNRQYRILRKLGWGHFSTVWLAKDSYAKHHRCSLARSTNSAPGSTSCSKTRNVVALKIVKSAPHYTEAAEDEIEILRCVNGEKTKRPPGSSASSTPALPEGGHAGLAHVVKLLNSFKHHGPHGKHVVMVFEVLGDNLLSVIDHMPRGLPIAVRGAHSPNEWIAHSPARSLSRTQLDLRGCRRSRASRSSSCLASTTCIAIATSSTPI